MDPQEKTLQMLATEQLNALEAKLKLLLQVTKQADCVPIYIAALRGLRAELEARQADHEEICAGADMNGS
jgi:hypothetical protein